MRKVNINKVPKDAKIAKSIISIDGKVLLAAGITINDTYINKLSSNGIKEIYICDEISKHIDVPEEPVCEEIRREAKYMIKKIMSRPSICPSIDTNEIKEIVEKIIDNILENKDIVANLSEIRTVDDYTFSHSVNVCILSVFIGIGLGFEGELLNNLGVGSLLHDIGKIAVPRDILKKPSQLTNDEFDEIKKHTLLGYEILKRNNGISLEAAFIALAHHERVDGSGYPYNLKDSNINKSAKIVAVADVYDALTSDRIYRNKMFPHNVIEYIMALKGQHFDEVIVDTFIKYVAHYPVGTGVILNSGEKGLVAKQHSKFPTKPIVRIVLNADGSLLEKQREVNLLENNSYQIVDVWDI